MSLLWCPGKTTPHSMGHWYLAPLATPAQLTTVVVTGHTPCKVANMHDTVGDMQNVIVIQRVLSWSQMDRNPFGVENKYSRITGARNQGLSSLGIDLAIMVSRRTNDVMITSLSRQNDVAISLRRNNDVIITPCAHWDSIRWIHKGGFQLRLTILCYKWKMQKYFHVF